jgi:hypothetical protein
MELTTESIPLLVAGFSLSEILNVNLSNVTFHWTQSALSRRGFAKSKSFIDTALSDSGKALMTSSELEIHLVKRKPPFASISRS